MNIAIVGCGFVGLTTGVTLAHLGHNVSLIEIDKDRLSLIKKRKAPFAEPGLSEMLSKGLENERISVTNDIGKGIENCKHIFIAVQTPVDERGVSNLKYLKESAKGIGRLLEKGQHVIVKSTVLPGTTEQVVLPILERESGLSSRKDFSISMNPEFLQEGRAIEDSLRPNRIVVGSTTVNKAREVMRIFDKIRAPKILTNIRTAEMIKLVSNCFLATKISYANEIANLCERIGIDVKDVMHGVGLDPRIGDKFLNAGLGFGGSCLPKDLSALISFCKENEMKPVLLEAVKEVNNTQPMRAINMLEEELGDLRNKRIALLGLAFKAGVDDVRDTRALPIAKVLLERGATVVGFDPLANKNFQRLLPDVKLAGSIRECLKDSDGCIIQTDDESFRKLTYKDFSVMRSKIIIDGRRVISPERVRGEDIRIRAIGLGQGLKS